MTLEVIYAGENNANGIYDLYDSGIYKHSTNSYILFRNELTVNAIIDYKLQSFKNKTMWIIAKYDISHTKSNSNITLKSLNNAPMQLLYYSPSFDSKTLDYIPRTPWLLYSENTNIMITNKNVTQEQGKKNKILYQHIDSKNSTKLSENSCAGFMNFAMQYMKKNGNIMTDGIPLVINHGSYWHYRSDSLNTNTNGNIFDINVKKAIPVDIAQFSTQHSWYKHFDMYGTEYILIPKLYGQIRGYYEENRKINQIRWHCNILSWIKREENNLKTNKQILAICKKYVFKFNCCFGANYHTDNGLNIACHTNPMLEYFLKFKYSQIFKYYGDYALMTAYKEENIQQIEHATQMGFKLYKELTELFTIWIYKIITHFVDKNGMEYRISNDILRCILIYCDNIAFPGVFQKKT
eukprot:114293_1